MLKSVVSLARKFTPAPIVKAMSSEAGSQGWKEISGSKQSLSTINPIRHCTEIHFVEPMKLCKKELLKLSIGDPALYLSPHPAVGEALKIAADSKKYHCLAQSAGLLETRESIAEWLSKYPSNHSVSADDIFITCGTNGALEICLQVLCEPGKTVLCPKPCYTAYKYLTTSLGIPIKFYNLLSERSWEVDLEQLEKQMDENVAAILINNPSNPCGAVYSKEHILDIIAVAEKHKLPIITDEVYADMVFKGKEFHPVGPLSQNVPVLTCGSISKKFLVPGWRCGWVVVHNRQGIFSKTVKLGITNMLMKLIAPGAVIQGAIPHIFKTIPDSFFDENMDIYETNANFCYSKLKDVPGLTPIIPAGTLYMMVKIDLAAFPEFEDDLSFLKCMIIEQGVVALPGSIFEYPGSMRIALIMSKDKLHIACDRITQFCSDHYRP